MTEGLRIWFRARELREQRLVLAAAALAVIVFTWLLVVRPLGDSLSEAKERHGEAVQALAEVRAQADLVTELQNAVSADIGGPLDTMLMQSATEAGFQVAKIEANGPRAATIAIGAVRPQAFFGWVNQMESSRGLVVDRLNATANSDKTLTVSVTFRTRGS